MTSYDKDKKAFERTAKRIQDQAQKNGETMSHHEAQEKLRIHLKRSKNK